MGWPPCRTRGVLRCLLVLLLAASPVAIVLAALNLRDYARSKPVEFDGSSYSADGVWSSHIDTESQRPVANPATSLPMIDGVIDIGGNVYGTSSREDTKLDR
jgi:hypothetical protein